MVEHTTTKGLLFPEMFSKPVVRQFDQQQGSSDGDAILLQAADRRMGLTSALAASLEDHGKRAKCGAGCRDKA